MIQERLTRMFQLNREHKALWKKLYGDATFHVYDHNDPEEKRLNDLALEISRLKEEINFINRSIPA